MLFKNKALISYKEKSHNHLKHQHKIFGPIGTLIK